MGSQRQRRRKGHSTTFKLALGQKIIEEGIKQTPNIYKAGVNKISNKEMKK